MQVDRGYYSASETDAIVVDLYDEPDLNATRQMQGRTLNHSIIMSKGIVHFTHQKHFSAVICEIGYYCKYGVEVSFQIDESDIAHTMQPTTSNVT